MQSHLEAFEKGTCTFALQTIYACTMIIQTTPQTEVLQEGVRYHPDWHPESMGALKREMRVSVVAHALHTNASKLVDYCSLPPPLRRPDPVSAGAGRSDQDGDSPGRHISTLRGEGGEWLGVFRPQLIVWCC